MCFTNDARSNFSALVDRSSEISLGGYETSNAFLITGNFAADAIAAWFEEDGLRIMSYANNLNNNKTLSQYCVCQLA